MNNRMVLFISAIEIPRKWTLGFKKILPDVTSTLSNIRNGCQFLDLIGAVHLIQQI
jgi:hypothetical protein